jgi:hypothetical protein
MNEVVMVREYDKKVVVSGAGLDREMTREIHESFRGDGLEKDLAFGCGRGGSWVDVW